MDEHVEAAQARAALIDRLAGTGGARQVGLDLALGRDALQRRQPLAGDVDDGHLGPGAEKAVHEGAAQAPGAGHQHASVLQPEPVGHQGAGGVVRDVYTLSVSTSRSPTWAEWGTPPGSAASSPSRR